jgi:hypothetical protein
MAGRWTSVLARPGIPTGDGRLLTPGGGTNRSLPLPLLWQPETGDGHDGAVIVGRIDDIQYADDMVTSTGLLFDSYEADQAQQLIDQGVIGPSIDLGAMEYTYDEATGTAVITAWEIAGATLVPIPAFADVYLRMAAPEPVDLPALEPDGARSSYVDEYGDYTYEVMIASAAPAVLPSLDLFRNPMLPFATPLTVTEPDERGIRHVFGHIAQWGQCHVGLPGCVTAPHSRSEYSYFLTGAERTLEGVDVPVGRLTVGGGHASRELGFAPAMAHYDDIGAAVASVFSGEDEHGIWVSGWILPDTPDTMVSELLRHPPSGDWRNISGELELIAVCAVNSQGFPVKRPRVAFSNGRQTCLIGAFGPTAAAAAPPPKSLAAFKLNAGVIVADAPDVKEDGPAPTTTVADAARARWGWTQKGTR